MQTRRQTKEAAATATAVTAASVEVYRHNISHTNDSENDIDNDNNEHTIYKVFEYDENDKGIFEVNIDFDGASEAWKENKKSSGNGCYKYRCIAFVAKTGIKCENFSKSGCDYCAMHNKNKIKYLDILYYEKSYFRKRR
jgi:hypothetical protein